jgi:Peptidase M15
MTREMVARPARWLHDEVTFGEAISAASGPGARRGAGVSMMDAARARLAPAHTTTVPDPASRGSDAALVAIAVTITASMILSLATNARAATRPVVVEEAVSGLGAASANPAIRLPADFGIKARVNQRPSLQDQGTLTAALGTAALGPAENRNWGDSAARSKTGIITDVETSGKIGPGFAKPKTLGRLAEDLPPRRRTGSPDSPVRYAALGKPERSANKAVSSSRLDGRISTSGHATACLPPSLKRVLNEIVANYGPIRINSTSRSHSHNRRVGGAPRSLHLECRAIDFAYHGSRRGPLITFLRNHWAVGGLGNYGRGGHIHIDDGPHRTW